MSSTAGHQSHRGSRTGLALARPVKEDFLAAVVVVGAGPGLGTAIARRFGVEDMPVGLISRSADSVNARPEEVA